MEIMDTLEMLMTDTTDKTFSHPIYGSENTLHTLVTASTNN